MNLCISNKVGEWLAEPSHTKRDLAAYLGVTTQTLNNRLCGLYDWPWKEVKLLADLFNCSVDELR